MEINTKNQASAIESYITQVQAKQKIERVEEQAPQGQKTIGGDTVQISDAAKRAQEAQGRIQEIPDVRADKVAEIRRSIEEGTYQIQPEAVAGKMIRESLLNDLLK